jgi:hypothetical protein
MIRRVLGAGKLFWAFFVGTYLLGITAAASQSDFPIGYSSLGGTYGFIALIEEQRLLEQGEAYARLLFTSVDRKSLRH